MQGIVAWARDLWPLLVSFGYFAGATWVTVDAVLRKRQVPTIIGWVGLAWLAPIVGALAYFLFGINRIRRSARALDLKRDSGTSPAAQFGSSLTVTADAFAAAHPAFVGLARLGERTTGNPLLDGHSVEPLLDGDVAYPAMLAAIDAARASVTLVSYIFDNDAAGQAFLDALVRARARGIETRVLIDDVGSRYTKPTMVRRLRDAGVPVAAFLPTRVPRLYQYANLRMHRKILVIDGQVGFTGGMNIRAGHWLTRAPAHPVRCVHFRVDGPVVADMQRAFVDDWAFETGERLEGERWFAPVGRHGPVAARGVPDGPDADIDNILEILLGALSVATRRARIVTPYFLPDSEVLRALHVAALRGVDVEIVLPGRSNVPLMDWAMTPQLPELIEKGCRIYFAPPPFDHSKLFVVDGAWSLIGSTNWDARSLRLNFEYNLECYDRDLAAAIDAIIDAKIAVSRPVVRDELLALPYAVRLRNGVARLFSPYL
ncbi:MAG TPA: cardiolipin synthase [Steroidobacteraceae bacterium]|nr:cardiolipin synthase [Steroidobacteraceae bacterium]